MREVLLRSDDLAAAEREVRSHGGAILFRLGPTLVVARLPETAAPESFHAARAVREEEQTAMSESEARAVRAFFLKQRTEADPDRKLPGEGLPWDAPGFEPPDGK